MPLAKRIEFHVALHQLMVALDLDSLAAPLGPVDHHIFPHLTYWLQMKGACSNLKLPISIFFEKKKKDVSVTIKKGNFF